MVIPKISVIVTNFNYGRYLFECVESIRNQKFKDFELIIVDDASTDNSLMLLKEYQRNRPSMKIIEHFTNKSLAISRIDGMKASTGDYILNVDAVNRAIEMLEHKPVDHPAEVMSLNIVSNRGRSIRPKTANQKRYVDAIEDHTITFGIGPAGTGKTYLAMAMAVAALNAKKINRIILTRPAVEAGEHLGFLPGTLSEKIDPYLRPLFDALHDMIDIDSIPRLMQSGIIEVAPLAYMRGRTLNDAFVILDEAQNTTPEQMKMFLTRLGFGSKMVVTGDVTQIDLPGGQHSGLKVVRDILNDIDDIAFLELTAEDVVRHRLIGDIVKAYDKFDEAKQALRTIRQQ